MLAALAWRNLWRQPQRTALSISSITLASAITIFLLALQLGGYSAMKENVLRLIDGFAQLQPPGYADDPDLRKAINNPAAVTAQIGKLAAVTATAPRATTYVILSNGPRSYGAALFGVDPLQESKVSALGNTLVAGRALTPADRDAVLVGMALARNLKLSLGSRVTLLGSVRDGSVAADILTVVGLFTTGAAEIDRQVVEMPLTRFQDDFGLEGQANVIAVVGRHLADIQASLPALRKLAMKEDLVLRDWTDLEPALHDVILLDASFSTLLYVSLIVIVVFIILNTLLMSVLERTHEFGMLMAIGMRPTRIGAMIWLELILLAGMGTSLGIALGSAITGWFTTRGITFPSAETLFTQWHMPATLHPSLNLTTALAGPLAIALAICVAGIVPYMRVRHLSPIAAMRAT